MNVLEKYMYVYLMQLRWIWMAYVNSWNSVALGYVFYFQHWSNVSTQRQKYTSDMLPDTLREQILFSN